MRNCLRFYIDGAWVAPASDLEKEVIDPSTEKPIARIAMGTAEDVGHAVAAAKAAFTMFSRTSPAERVELLAGLEYAYTERLEEFARRISLEMGAPIKYSREVQAQCGSLHIATAIETLRAFEFERLQGTTLVVKEAIGVCGLITPWNFPINTLVSKVLPALAAGCCVVLKASELSPLSALLFAEAIDAVGFPKGVFNLVNGDGPVAGEALAAHPDVAMISITGSTAAGIRVAKVAADTVKRVHQELGGKSANILLLDADLEKFVPMSVAACYRNSGQSCSAPTRLLVHRDQLAQVEQLAAFFVQTMKVGLPSDETTVLGPVVNQTQFDKVQRLISSGLQEGAKLIAGGVGRPSGFDRGYFVRPTIFSEVTPNMRIAQEEIFGPVLSILPYDSEEEAISIANGTVFGLAAYVQSSNLEGARRVASRMHAGTVHINFPPYDTRAPFGGYKQSGNGREYGAYGLDDFLELKAITGFHEIAGSS